jgi:hypothetical protein
MADCADANSNLAALAVGIEMGNAVAQVAIGEVKVPVSFGELIDKITILEIKTERMTDDDKLKNVRHELELLQAEREASAPAAPTLDAMTRELKAVNLALWDIEDRIRDYERQSDFGPEFIRLARAVYQTNDRRAAIKRRINEITGSALIEEKSYRDWMRADAPGCETR